MVKLVTAAIVASALALGLTGCITVNVQPDPSASPSPAPTPSETTTPPAAAEFMIPGCDALLALDDARAVFGESTELLTESTASEVLGVPTADYADAFEVPETLHVLAEAEPTRWCVWGVPNSNGAFTVTVASITEADRAVLEPALTTAGFASSTMGTVTGYDLEIETVIGTVAGTHLFTGQLWIAVTAPSPSTSGQIAGKVLDSMRTANPTFGL